MTKDLKSRIRDRALAQRKRRALQAAVIKARREHLSSRLDEHLAFPVADVAGILGLSPQTIYRFLASGELIGFKSSKAYNGRWVVREHAIAAFIAGREKATLDKVLKPMDVASVSKRHALAA